MAARRFRWEIGGEVLVGFAWTSERELEAWLADSGRLPPDTTSDTAPPEVEARPVGRPSFDQAISAAVAEIGTAALDHALPLAQRRRAVLRKIAENADADSIPNSRTVDRWLVAHGTRQKSGQKRAPATSESERSSPPCSTRSSPA